MFYNILFSMSRTGYNSFGGLLLPHLADLLAEAGAAAAITALANLSFLPIPVAKERTGTRDTKGP